MDATKGSDFEYLGGDWRPKSGEARSRAPVGGSAEVDQVGEHSESIMCPKCGMIQDAIVIHTWPWYSYVHECPCGYIIMESEWERVEPNVTGECLRDRNCGGLSVRTETTEKSSDIEHTTPTAGWHEPDPKSNEDHWCKGCGRRIVFDQKSGRWWDPTFRYDEDRQIICYG